MGNKQADDDDDEGFGDFKFISFSNSNQTTQKDDDDWGDFIQHFSPKQDTNPSPTPIQFPPSNGFSHPSNPSIIPSQNFEFFNGTSDPWVNSTESQLTKVDSEKDLASPASSLWEKPRGAIPLSIFGDEEEDESESTNPPIDNTQNLFTSSKQTSPVKNEISFGSGFAIKDIIVNLYTQSEHLKTESESISNSNSNLVDENGVLDDNDDDGWEFKDASFEKRSEDNNSSQLQRDDKISALPELKFDPLPKTNGDIQVGVGVKACENSEGVDGQLGDNWFVTSNEFSNKSTRTENGVVFESSRATNSSECTSDPFGQSKQIITQNGFDSSRVNENFDSDDNFFEFKDSFSETGIANGYPGSGQKENLNGGDQSAGRVEVVNAKDEIQVNGKEFPNHQGEPSISHFSNGKLDSDDSLFGSNMSSIKLDSGDSFFGEGFSNHKLDSSDSLFGEDVFTYKPSTSMRNGINNQVIGSNLSLNDLISNLYSQAEPSPSNITPQGATLDGLSSAQEVLSSDLMNGGDDFDDSWEFKGAPSEAGAGEVLQKLPTELNSTIASSKGTMENGLYSAQMDLSSEIVNGEDDFADLWQFRGAPSEGFLAASPEDALQKFHTEPKSSFISPPKDPENGFHSARKDSNSESVIIEDDFDEISWEFRGAVSENAYVDTGTTDTLQKCSTESNLKTYIDFYSRLKEDSYFIALRHIDGLKKAKTAAALSSEDAKADALHDEIQAAHKKLHQGGVFSEEVKLKERQPRNVFVQELLKLVKQPKFQILELEYQLSQQILSAEKNLSSAINMFEHAISMAKILNLGSMEDQFAYISTWSKILSVCAQELKHGSFIWKQSLQKKVHRQILSKTQGQQYVLALGEIYRVVEVMRASITLYKPWLLSSLENPKQIFALLEECTAAWSDSRLEEAILGFSDQFGFAFKGTSCSLMESIKFVRNLDMVSLQNHASATQEPICRLSFLLLKMVPGMKAVAWNGEQYFLPLANLWANLISPDPPILPRIVVK